MEAKDEITKSGVNSTVFKKEFEFDMRGELDIINITDEVAAAVRQSAMSDGTATVFVPGATGAVTCLDFEPGVVADFQQALERLFPIDMAYNHERFQVGGNGHAHVRAGMLGPSLVVPFSDGSLILGTWQQIVLINCDNRSRNRNLIVQILGA